MENKNVVVESKAETKVKTITHVVYNDVCMLSEQQKSTLRKTAFDKGLQINGNLSKAHVVLYQPILETLLSGCSVELVEREVSYYYVYRDTHNNRTHVREAEMNNLVGLFIRECGLDKIWCGDTLTVISNNYYLLNSDIQQVFVSANAEKSDIVVRDDSGYTLIDFGVLHYFQQDGKICALVKKELLPNGVHSTEEELTEVLFYLGMTYTDYDIDMIYNVV